MIWLLAFAASAQESPVPPPEPVSEVDMDRAAELFESGVRMYDEAKYDAAIEAFQASYELSDEHALLYNIANAQERLGDLAGTVETLNTYRVYADADEQAVIQRRVDALEKRLLTERRKEAEAAEASATLAAAAAAAAAAVKTEPARPAPPMFETRSNSAKWALIGAGVGTSVVFGTLAGLSHAEGQTHRDAGDKASYGNARTLNNVSLALAIVGAGLGGVGLALPSKRTVPIVGLDIRQDRTDLALTWTYR